MKKRYLIMALAVLALVAFAIPAAFADDTDNPAKTWFEQKFVAKKAFVDQAVQNGQMTKEQGKAFKEHFDQMYQWHEQNNFTCPFGGPGADMGRGYGRGFGRGGQGGPGMGYGPGFMNGFGQAPVQ